MKAGPVDLSGTRPHKASFLILRVENVPNQHFQTVPAPGLSPGPGPGRVVRVCVNSI